MGLSIAKWFYYGFELHELNIMSFVYAQPISVRLMFIYDLVEHVMHGYIFYIATYIASMVSL
jgi:hypothetical protein